MKIEYISHPQTAIRLALLANGYSPIASAGKSGMPRNWQSLIVNEKQIRTWDRVKAFTDMAGDAATTSVRIEGQLFVLDIDVTHGEAADEIWQWLLDNLPDFMAGCLIRSSGGVKVALFGRTDVAGLRHRHTASFVNPEAPEGPGERVECFGSGSGRHFVVYGPYIGKDGKQVGDREYTFEGPDMRDTALDALPVISGDDIALALDACDAILRRHMALVEGTTKGAGEQAQAYDLLPDMQWMLGDGTMIALADAERAVEASGATGEELRGFANLWDPASRTPNRVKAALGQTGLVLIDWKTGTSHRWADRAPVEKFDSKALTEGLNKLREEVTPQDDIADGWPADPPGLAPDASFGEALVYGIMRFGILSHSADAIDIYADDAVDAVYRQGGVQAILSPYKNESIGPRGGVQSINAFHVWKESLDRTNIHSVQLRPDKPWPVYREGGNLHKNLWRRPALAGAERGEAGTFFDFLLHLLPDETERVWFIKWLAHKFRHPHIPGVTPIMMAVDPATGAGRYGTGRGTLFDILAQLFGRNYVADQSFTVISGRSGQSQFSDWIANSVLVTVNEAQEGENDTSARSMQAAYEALKETCDPQPRKVTVTPKGRPRYQAWVSASFIIATNHSNALRMPVDDRRFTVLSNGEVLPPGHPIHAWAKVPANIITLRRALLKVGLEDFDMFAALQTAAKAHMAVSRGSDMDGAFDAAQSELRPLFTRAQLYTAVLKHVEDRAGNIDGMFSHIMRQRCRGLRTIGKGLEKRVRIDGQQKTVFHFGTVPPREAENDDDAIRRVVEANGKDMRDVLRVIENEQKGEPER